MVNYKYMSIDPSGSGTTGIFFYDSEKNEEIFATFKSKIWKEHFIFIKAFCEDNNADYIIYETTNFIKIRGFDLTSLFKLFGIIESLTYLFPIKKCETVLVGEIKRSYKKLKEGSLKINNLFFKAGRGGGWFRNDKKIDIHQLDAFLVLFCHLNKKEKSLELKK
jgi:hypothetical protein